MADAAAALLGPACSGEAMRAGLRVLLYPLGSNVVMRTACCSVGIALPVYFSFKAIEKNDPNEQRRWLIYWAVYGSFSLLETFPNKILSWNLFEIVEFSFLEYDEICCNEQSNRHLQHHLFPEKYFNDKEVPALDMKIKKLMSMNAESCRLIGWMEKGVKYALQKKYLKTLLFCICESPKGPMIEEYSCQAFFLFYHEFFLAA